MKTEITKIKLQLAGREIELTSDEAREIQKELNKLFALEVRPSKTEEVHHHHHYATPIYVDRYVPQWPHRWDVICYGGSCTAGSSGIENGTLCMAIGQSSAL